MSLKEEIALIQRQSAQLRAVIAEIEKPWSGTGFRQGEKCPCVCGIYSDGSGPEVASEDCDLCNGTGYVGGRVPNQPTKRNER